MDCLTSSSYLEREKILISTLLRNTHEYNIQDTLNKFVNYAEVFSRAKEPFDGVKTPDGLKAIIENVDDCLVETKCICCWNGEFKV